MISQKSLNLFQKAAHQVPAYKKFLKQTHVESSAITSTKAFTTLPRINKKTYLQKYDCWDLMWDKNRDQELWVCSTSGSTGEPYYFYRDDSLAARGAAFVDQFLATSSYGSDKRTLVIMAFGMGVWIGGVITHRSFEIALSKSHASVSLLPTGYNKAEVFKALKKLSPSYDQTILIGYPPFTKEVIDEAKSEGIDLKKLNMRLLFAAEAFTETFRDYVCKHAGVKNPIMDTLNIYGTADVGAMAFETPLSILVRRLSREDPLLYNELFGQIDKTPTLAQYDPSLIEFEEVDGELLLTSDGAIPLIRYEIGDNGGVRTYQQIEKLFRKHDIDLSSEIEKAGISDFVHKNPFVFVYERTDLSASLHGIVIYPEYIKDALIDSAIAKYFSERFTMATKQDIHHNQFLQVNIELQKDVGPTAEIEAKALTAIRQSMIRRSSEFSEVSKSKDSEKLVQVVLWTHGHPRYFAPGGKQKWVEKA